MHGLICLGAKNIADTFSYNSLDREKRARILIVEVAVQKE